MPMTTICDEFSAVGPRGYGYWIETPPGAPMLAAVATSGFGRLHAERARGYPHLGTFIVLVRDGADRHASSGGGDGGPRRARAPALPALAHRRAPPARGDGERRAAPPRRRRARGAHAAHRGRRRAARGRRGGDPRRVHGAERRERVQRARQRHGAAGRGPTGRDEAACASEAARFGARFGAPGVYVADGSLLPTGLGVNPQATIMALGHLVADGMLG
jgi:hypothetical protein